MRYRNVMMMMVAGAWMSLAQAEDARTGEPDWMAPSFGPLTPNVHLTAAVGDSSGDPAELAAGHHDPTREDGTVQGLEAGMSLRAGSLEGYAVYNLYYGAEEEWDGKWEEAFLSYKDLPGGFTVRGGRMLSRFGQHNTKHLHAWDFVDMPLVWGRFLGDDGLITEGGDITWISQGIANTFGITVGYGEALAHNHDHDHGHEHEEDHHDEEHAHGAAHADDHDHDHDEEHHEDEPMEHDHADGDDHDHAHGDHVSFNDGVGSGRAFARFRRDDFNAFETGVSLAVGEDEAERQIVVAGADLSYTWRENGLQPGGRAVTWLTEVLVRDVEDGGDGHDHGDHDHDDHGDHEEHDHHADHDEHEYELLPGASQWGFYSQVIYTHNPHLDAGMRVGFVEGDEAMGASDRFRVSPAITTYLDANRRVQLRAQYNYDDIQDGEEEHSFWLQLGLAWGGAEVR